MMEKRNIMEQGRTPESGVKQAEDLEEMAMKAGFEFKTIATVKLVVTDNGVPVSQPQEKPDEKKDQP
jgi:hypothetical protein